MKRQIMTRHINRYPWILSCRIVYFVRNTYMV
jgi:hypothetical protein